MSNNPYALEAQNGIFNFFFALVNVYAQSMPFDDAFEMALGWMESFTKDVKEKHSELIDKRDAMFNKMKS